MLVTPIQKEDFYQILDTLPEYWGERHTEVRSLHHPMFVYEFGDYGLVIKESGKILAYLLGFLQPQKQMGYIHFVGVHQTQRKRGLAKSLYLHFFEMAKNSNCNQIKALTTVQNAGSISFHRALGFNLIGEPNADGIPVVKNYRGPSEDRVVFIKTL